MQPSLKGLDWKARLAAGAVMLAALFIYCDARIDLDVSLKRLLGGAPLKLDSQLVVQLAACEDKETVDPEEEEEEDSEDDKDDSEEDKNESEVDSGGEEEDEDSEEDKQRVATGEPSESLKELKQTVVGIFPSAQYVKCYVQGFVPHAVFRIPIHINPAGKTGTQTIHLRSRKNRGLTLHIPKSVERGLKKLEEESYGLKALDLKIHLKLRNDTATDQKFHVAAAYVDEMPRLYEELKLPKGKAVTIRPSDVALDKALSTGSAPLFFGADEARVQRVPY